MLPRTREQVAMNIDNYVVARCPAGSSHALPSRNIRRHWPRFLRLPSPLGARKWSGHRRRPGNGAPRPHARYQRDLRPVAHRRFFLSLDYEATSISRYPEKLARYDRLSAEGVEIVPKRCFQKVLENGFAGSRSRGRYAGTLRAS